MAGFNEGQKELLADSLYHRFWGHHSAWINYKSRYEITAANLTLIKLVQINELHFQLTGLYLFESDKLKGKYL